MTAASGTLPYPHTRFTSDGLWTDVYLYDTKIVSFNGGYAGFYYGGHPSVLTVRRMNQISAQFGLGIRIFKVRGLMFGEKNADGAVPFVDGRLFMARP